MDDSVDCKVTLEQIAMYVAAVKDERERMQGRLEKFLAPIYPNFYKELSAILVSEQEM